MDVLELIDETFDKGRTELYELSIQVSLNGFSFAVKDTIRNTYIALVSKPFSNTFISHQNWDTAITQTVSQYPLLSLKFKKVFFEYTESSFTLVPSEFFEVDKLKDLFELTHSLPEYFELHHTNHSNGSSYVQIFSVPYILSGAWLKIQPSTKFISPISSLLFYSKILKTDNLIQVDISESRVILVHHSKEKLVAANSFDYKNENDIAYYILNFCKGLGVDHSSISLHISGLGFEYKNLQTLLSNYFSHISLDARYNSIHFSYQLLRHRVKYFKLFNSTSICE